MAVSSYAFHPESPEVRAVIDRAMTYLEAETDRRPGGKCLIGIVFLKEKRREHVRVQEALEAALRIAQMSPEQLLRFSETYSLALAAMFLAEYDVTQYHAEFDKLTDAIIARQLENGSWTYGNKKAGGDTSQSQYAVLACWTAHRAGYRVPPEAASRICGWLQRTQDPSGGFGYQPIDPGEDAESNNQANLRASTCVAGLGSLYIGSTMLGVRDLVTRPKEGSKEVPDAFKRVPFKTGSNTNEADFQVTREFTSHIRNALSRGDGWMNDHRSKEPQEYFYYYLYGLERYEAFRSAGRKSARSEPRWYNDGVRSLIQRQQPNGSFSPGQPALGGPIDASFAVLFLLRNTQRSIAESLLGDGMLIGGRGMPSDTQRIRVVEGRVVSATQRRSLAAVQKMLADPNASDLLRLAEEDAVGLIDSSDASPADIESLRGLANSDSPVVRRVAIQALASHCDLDNVPTFLAALEDSDRHVVRQARDGLRRVSRKFLGFGMPDTPSESERAKAVAEWKQWYRSLRPDGH